MMPRLRDPEDMSRSETMIVCPAAVDEKEAHHRRALADLSAVASSDGKKIIAVSYAVPTEEIGHIEVICASLLLLLLLF